MKRIGLLVLICMFTLLMGGCAENVESTPVGDDPISMDTTKADENNEENAGADVVSEEKAEALKTFRVEDMKSVDLRDEFVIEDYYIKNKVVVSNRYFIDEDRVLWGYGYNEFGQLGIGKADAVETVYTEPIKIAENVVSVDCSVNNYFCIYLTADGKLYGMGSNMLGLLGQEYSAEPITDVFRYEAVPSPVLLMEDVAYARAGREAIVALDKVGSVWWWGQYRSTYNTRIYDRADLLYWQSTEDESNPMKMLYNHPTKILENCIYATTGDWSGAAIGQNGELYTWGLNIFGECGTEVTGDEYLRTPTKVLDTVRMVWPVKIAFGSIEEKLPEIGRYDTTYLFNMFVQLRDGTMLAAGENLGDKDKVIAVTGDLPYSSAHTYSDAFVPIVLEEFSEVGTRKKLQQLAWGMSMEEAEEILSQEGIQHFRTAPENGNYIVVEDSRYFLYFDEDGHLNRIFLQEGGSRDLQFEMGMTMEEVRSKIDDDFIVQEYDDGAVYWTRESVDGSYLGFIFNDDGLYCVYESAGRPDPIDGVTMEAAEASDVSVTIRITNETDKDIQFGDAYYLEMQDAESGEWHKLDSIIDNGMFHAVAYILRKGSPYEQTVNFEWLYGKLEPGKYRIVKEITDFRGTGDYTDYTYTAEFDVK